MRQLAIGDIHGCYHALTTLAEFVPFKADDQFITLGDYVDRGHQTKQVIDWLLARKAEARLTSLRGNHEVMMLEARDDERALDGWLGVGGVSTLMSYGEDGRLTEIPESHWAFVESTQLFVETDTHLFVHGNLDARKPMEEQSEMLLLWGIFDMPEAHMSGKTMVCGHTAQRSGRPKNVGHAVCIDTWVYGNGWLTALDIDTGEYWQANERGETRSASLDNPAAG